MLSVDHPHGGRMVAKVTLVESMRGETTMRQKERETERQTENEKDTRMGIAFYHQNIAPALHFLQ